MESSNTLELDWLWAEEERKKKKGKKEEDSLKYWKCHHQSRSLHGGWATGRYQRAQEFAGN